MHHPAYAAGVDPVSRPVLCLATWNLQGAEGVDVEQVADRLRALAAPGLLDVVLLQEVHIRQARALGKALGLTSSRWAFKHWPVVRSVEGLAVLTRHPLVRTRARRVQRAPFFSWRRRIVLLAEVVSPAGSVVVANVHLSPHDLGPLREAETRRLAGALVAFGAGRDAVIVGDFNDGPQGTPLASLRTSGWRDAWREVHGDRPEPAGATNWTPGAREGRPPSQRLDYVMVPPGWAIERVDVGGPDVGGWDVWAALSDHLPVVAVLRRADDRSPTA